MNIFKKLFGPETKTIHVNVVVKKEDIKGDFVAIVISPDLMEVQCTDVAMVTRLEQTIDKDGWKRSEYVNYNPCRRGKKQLG